AGARLQRRQDRRSDIDRLGEGNGGFGAEDEVEALRLGVCAHLLTEHALQTRVLLVAARGEVVLELALRPFEIARAVAQVLLSAAALILGHGGAVLLQLFLLGLERLALRLQGAFTRRELPAQGLRDGLALGRLLQEPRRGDEAELG